MLACSFEFTIIASVIAMYVFISPSWPLAAAACSIILIGSRLRALGNIAHECAHHTFTSNRAFNNLCGHLLCIFDFRSFQKYKREHMAHHRFLGDKILDPDYLGADFKYFNYLKNFLPTIYNHADPAWVNLLRLIWCFGLASLIASPTTRQVTLVCYVIPYFSTYFLLRVFSDFSDHWGLANKPNRELRSRNHFFKSNILNFLLLPRNDGFHLLHHLFPNLPTWCYKATHKELMATNTAYRRLHS